LLAAAKNARLASSLARMIASMMLSANGYLIESERAERSAGMGPCSAS